jgi:integrase
MLRHVIKQGGVYRGRFRLSNGPKIHDIALRTSKKHHAEELLKRHVEELENELLGFGKPKAMRAAAALPIADMLGEYRNELEARGRGAKHASAAFHGIERLCQACGWKRLGDVTAEGFGRWRASQTMAPKTSNEYLAMISAFFTWLERNGRWQANPLKSVVKAETRGRQRRERRALSDEQITRLVQCSGRRGVVYLVAAFTGLRRGEMKALLWCDVDLDGASPCLRIRASTTKNKRRAILPLLPPLVKALRELREFRGGNPSGKVFHYMVPMMARFRADLDAAGIPFEDELGRRVDFHALRKTFCTVLQRRGVTMRTAQELMRHSDPRLTGDVYTDATALPLFEELRKASASAPSLLASQKRGKRGLKEAKAVPSALAALDGQRAAGDLVVQGCPSGKLEARAGIEPAVELLQSSALPLGDRAVD